MKKRGFLEYFRKKKYSKFDFLEPLIFLPFGYGIMRLIAGKFNILTLIIAGLLIFVYIPTIHTFLAWREKK